MPHWREELEKIAGSWQWPSPSFDVDASKTALVMVDMQVGGTHPEYGYGPRDRKQYPETFSYLYNRVENIVIPNQIKLLENFRRNGWRIVYTTNGPELADGVDFSRPRRRHMKEKVPHKGTFEHGIRQELAPQEGALVLNKTTTSAFHSTGLDHILRMWGIETLVIGGMITNACVEHTARCAAEIGYQVILVEDACVAYNEMMHNTTMVNAACLFGMVLDTQEAITMLEGSMVSVKLSNA